MSGRLGTRKQRAEGRDTAIKQAHLEALRVECLAAHGAEGAVERLLADIAVSRKVAVAVKLAAGLNVRLRAEILGAARAHKASLLLATRHDPGNRCVGSEATRSKQSNHTKTPPKTAKDVKTPKTK